MTTGFRLMADRLGSLAAADTLDSPSISQVAPDPSRCARPALAIACNRRPAPSKIDNSTNVQRKELGVLVSSGQVVISPVRHYPRHKMLQHSSALQLLEAACVRSRSSWPLPSSLPSLQGAAIGTALRSRRRQQRSQPSFRRNTRLETSTRTPILRRLVGARSAANPRLVEPLGNLERLRGPDRRRRAAAAHAVDHELDVRALVFSRRRAHPLLE